MGGTRMTGEEFDRRVHTAAKKVRDEKGDDATNAASPTSAEAEGRGETSGAHHLLLCCAPEQQMVRTKTSGGAQGGGFGMGFGHMRKEGKGKRETDFLQNPY